MGFLHGILCGYVVRTAAPALVPVPGTGTGAGTGAGTGRTGTGTGAGTGRYRDRYRYRSPVGTGTGTYIPNHQNTHGPVPVLIIATRAPDRARSDRARGALGYAKNVRAKEPCTGPTVYFPICRLFFRFFRFLGAKSRIKNLS